jgi:lipopolysaccharide export system protein LptA
MSSKHRPWLLALLLLLPASVPALESDAKKPVYVDSDTATYDDQKGVAVYTGRVHTVQGSLVVDADQMTVHLNQGKIDKIIATGKPVHIVQTPESGKNAIDATALKAEYFPSEYRLVLIDKAVVLQGGNTYTSDRIEYDTRNSVAIAGERSSGSKRVHTVIGPKGAESSPAPARKR